MPAHPVVTGSCLSVFPVPAPHADAKPGDVWNYRNTNYLLLGIIIHKVTGKHYADFLQERLFKPWDMTATRLISDADIIPNRAAGYEPLERVEYALSGCEPVEFVRMGRSLASPGLSGATFPRTS